MAERVGFEPTVPVSRNRRFRVAPVMTTSVPLQTLRAPSGLEKILEKPGTLLSHQTALNLNYVIKSPVNADLIHRDHCPGLWIKRSEYQPLYSCMDHGAGTHHARFQGYIQSGTCQAIVADPGACPAHDQHLGMTAWIIQFNAPIAVIGKDISVRVHDNGANRNLTPFPGHSGLFNCQFHMGNRGIVPPGIIH